MDAARSKISSRVMPATSYMVKMFSSGVSRYGVGGGQDVAAAVAGHAVEQNWAASQRGPSVREGLAEEAARPGRAADAAPAPVPVGLVKQRRVYYHDPQISAWVRHQQSCRGRAFSREYGRGRVAPASTLTRTETHRRE